MDKYEINNNEDLILISNGHPLREISIKSIEGYLRANGINCRSIYLDSVTELHQIELEQILALSQNAKLVGFSMMSKDVMLMLPLIEKLKKNNIPILLGGIHPTAMPEDSLKYCDFICIGEGELTFLKLYKELLNNDKNFADIPNLAYKENGNVIMPKNIHMEADLDILPYPDYKFIDSYMLKDGFIQKIPQDKELRKAFFNLNLFLYYSSRGCPNACAYCSNSLYHKIAKETKNKWYRTLSPKRIIEEIKEISKYLAMDIFWFNDDDFMARSVEEIEEVCKFIREELNVPIFINATPNSVTKEKMDILSRSGIKHIAFGIQTGSDRVLRKFYTRPVFSDTVRESAKLISNYYKDGIVVDYGFILENPYEDNYDLRETFNLFLDLPKPVTLSLYSSLFFPSTKLTIRALNEKVIMKNDVAINKDYRSEISPCFVHTLFQAFYELNIPKSYYKIFLSDEIFISEENCYPRLLLANYFINKTIRQIAVDNEKQYNKTKEYKEILQKAGKNAALFYVAVIEISKNYKKPTNILKDNENEELTLCYQNDLEIGFKSRYIIRIQKSKGEIEYYPKSELKSDFSQNFLYNEVGKNSELTLKNLIKYPKRTIRRVIKDAVKCK